MEDNNISNIANDTDVGSPILTEKKETLARKYFLKGITLGISISESDNLEELGYSVAHLRDAMVETARYILALGGRVAYGGDMRQGGFTELMFELLAYYKADKELPPKDRFQSYLSWPLSLNLTAEKQAELSHDVSFRRIEPPHDLRIANSKEFLKPDSCENLYIWSRCLTKMREEMESECNARIFIGGRTKGFKGKCPGILEELLIAIKNNHPIYLVGAFGGITKDAIDAFNETRSNAFSSDFHLESTEYRDLFNLYNSRHEDSMIDYQHYYSILQKINFSGLSKMNGLNESENRRLAITPHISEIIYLILKGLTNCFAT
jgi:hypothetical protein